MWEKGTSGNPRGRERKGTYRPCSTCGKIVYRCQALSGGLRFCSKGCSNNYLPKKKAMSKRQSNRVVSPETKAKLAEYTKEKASSWKGGRPKCPICGKLIHYGSARCGKHKVFTKEHRRKQGMSLSLLLRGKMPINNQGYGKFRNVQRGMFEINEKPMFFRSKWEANYALYLDFLKRQGLIISWGYEKKVFIFKKIKSGTTSYRPDFVVKNNDKSIEYHEIKGWLTPRSKTQLSRMRKYYPNEKLIILYSKEYLEIVNKLGKMLSFF